MKRLTILILGVFAFCLYLSFSAAEADAGIFARRGCRGGQCGASRPSAAVKVEVKRRHAVDRKAPTGCPDGKCPLR